VELLCCQAIRLEFFQPEAFLRRAKVRARPKAQEDLKVYLVWSARLGFSAEKHALAYWQLAEGFLEELELRTATQGALLEDRTFHNLVDHAEISVNLAIRYDGGRMGLSHASSQHLLQRLETLRSARRSAVEFLDAPLIAGVRPEETTGADAYAVSWPLDLAAGVPDCAIFSRTPTIGSSQTQRLMELLFLGCEGVLDIMATLSNLALRATAFATAYPECLHWKYRPKPIHLHLHAASIDRLAQSLLCFLIMKQLGEKADETGKRHRWLCSLLTAVIFCRTLTTPQRKEVDRLLKLLILASADTGSWSRTFPWLELDDDRKTTLPMGKMNDSKSETSRGTQHESRFDEGGLQRRASRVAVALPVKTGRRTRSGVDGRLGSTRLESENSSESEGSNESWSSGFSSLGSFTRIDLAFALEGQNGCGLKSFGYFLSQCLALTVAVLFFLYLGPGQRQGEGVAAEKMREVLSDVPQLVLAVGPGETVPCHREPAFFFVPFSFGILASLVANWILWTAGCWHFWITGFFLQLGCIYGFVTALDECILSLRQGLVEAGSSVYLICPLGYLKAPGLDPFIMKHFLFLTGKIASLVLRVSIQLLIALWVEAMTLYRLKCMKAVSGRKRSALCLQVTFLWWMQVMLLPVAMLPVRSITPFARKLIFFAFLASYLLGAVQIIRLLLTIIARLREYYATAERHRDTEEALECLQRGRERVWINCIGYFVHVILGIAIGTIVVISNEQAFNTRDEVDSEDFPTLLRISFILPAFHIFILIGGPWVLGNANATVAQQSQFCVWRRKRTRTQRLEPSWLEKVRDLSQRGITVKDLLAFYRRLGKDLMPHFDPQVHTTRDVVRCGVIPVTRQSGCAYAVHIADGKPVPVRNMVTHTWENLFRDLVAAVVADALDENTFDVIAHILQEDPSLLEQMLGEVNQLHATYWICAFAVNQHTSICNINPGRNVDSLTKQPYPLCDCRTPKFLNNTPPLDGKGRSIQCELNKFDHMMAIIAADNRHFAEVLAIDQDFGLFNRAWCVAELAEARLLRMPQHVKIPSKSALARHMDGLRHLRVQELRATRPEDVQEILSKIPDFESFNQALHELIFDPQLGILANWRDLDAARQMEEVGRLLRWGRADAGRGLVWSSW
ncbi:Hypothetical protein SCF082_LOCUS34225, partial [Durusdinium trenchii]